MATKYVRADGTASWTNANGPESNAANCCAWSTVSTNPSPGDEVVISGLGGVYRETFNIVASGTSLSAITFTGSNTPTVNGANVLTGFSLYSGSVYQLALATEPEQMFMDGTRGDRQGSILACVNEYDWYWTGGTLYVFAPSNPDSEYTTVEGSYRTNCIYNEQDYITIDGITCVKSNQIGIRNVNGIGVTIKNCTCTDHYWHGIQSNDAGANQIIEDNTVSYNGVFGIQVKGLQDNAITRRNDVSYTAVSSNQKYSLDSNLRYSGGIEHYAKNYVHTPSYITENYVHDIGTADNTSVQAGIWCDGDAQPGSAVHINRNWVEDCAGAGIFVEISWNIHVYGNTVIDCAFRNSSSRDANILLNTWAGYTASGNFIYNNTSIGGSNGLAVYCNNPDPGAFCTNNTFRNNIVVDATVRNLYCYNGGDNDGTWGSGNVYNANCFGAESAGFINWGGTDYDTYDSWIAASSQTDNNLEADPQFAGNPGFGQAELDPASPCRDAAINLGSPYNICIMPDSTWPNDVKTGDQDDY